MENTTLKVSSSLSSFAVKLFSLLPANQNLIFSPASIYMALAMAGFGSNGETLEEFKKVLGFDNVQQFASDISIVTNKLLANSEGIQTRIANKIYSGLSNLNPEYEAFMKTQFSSGLEQVNFVEHSEQIRQGINKWVEETTNKKIKNLLQPGTLTPQTVMVLVNAIYFKGNWDQQFSKDSTHKAQFAIAQNQQVQVDMMSLEKKYPYSENETCQYIQIPYKGKEYVMEIILPNQSISLEHFENKLTFESLLYLRNNAPEIKVNLGLPKFKIEDSASNSLKSILNKLGLINCFSQFADFSGMSGKKDVFVDDVIHKAMIEVNEEGAEAAAATAVVMRSRKMQANPQLYCNRPFIYTISHKPSGSIIFMGRVNNPSQSN